MRRIRFRIFLFPPKHGFSDFDATYVGPVKLFAYTQSKKKKFLIFCRMGRIFGSIANQQSLSKFAEYQNEKIAKH